MTPRTTAQERHECDRVAWNLPRRPPPAVAPVARTSSTTVGPQLGRKGPGHDPTVERGLDWRGFRLRHFPGRRRHRLPALVAYGAYRASGGVDRPAEHVALPEVARPLSAESAAAESWEDEGGAAWPANVDHRTSSQRERRSQPVETVLTGQRGALQ